MSKHGHLTLICQRCMNCFSCSKYIFFKMPLLLYKLGCSSAHLQRPVDKSSVQQGRKASACERVTVRWKCELFRKRIFARTNECTIDRLHGWAEPSSDLPKVASHTRFQYHVRKCKSRAIHQRRLTYVSTLIVRCLLSPGRYPLLCAWLSAAAKLIAYAPLKLVRARTSCPLLIVCNAYAVHLCDRMPQQRNVAIYVSYECIQSYLIGWLHTEKTGAAKK